MKTKTASRAVRLHPVVSCRPSSEEITPDKEGWWGYEDEYGEHHEVEVYLHPTGHLCVWCEDVGASGYQQTLTDGDEINGHIPVWCRPVWKWTGEWRPFEDKAANVPSSATGLGGNDQSHGTKPL